MPRVLIVTYDFPPVGGSGVQRVAKLAKYLPRYGWQPVVLTTRRGRESNPRDASLLDDLGGVEVHRTLAIEPFGLLTRARRGLTPGSRARGGARFHFKRPGPWNPASWLIPDWKLPWVPFGLAWAAARKPDERCDIVFSSLPTPTAAVLGSMIARRWGVPHVIDYRDPWSGAPFIPRRPRPLELLEQAWESKILAGASAVTHVPGALPPLRSGSIPTLTVHNGFDEEDFRGARPRRMRGRFVIAHVGLLRQGRDIEPLARALEILRARRPGIADEVHFVQVGLTDEYVAGQIERLRARARVTALPAVPHAEAIGHMLGADLLYLPVGRDHVPGKTYEYLRSGTPILAVGARAGTLEEVLAEACGAPLLHPDDAGAIARRIERLIESPDPRPAGPPPAVRVYSREAMAERIAGVLDDVASIRVGQLDRPKSNASRWREGPTGAGRSLLAPASADTALQEACAEGRGGSRAQ